MTVMSKPQTAESKATEPQPANGVSVAIRDGSEVLNLSYDGALTQHKSSLWWGTAVGFRAMQAAAKAFSTAGLWSRDNLHVVSGHPGPGVLDSINYVTGARDRERLTVMRDPNCESKCNSKMRFEWWISDGERTAAVKLRPEFLSRDFYELADRLFTEDEREGDKWLFEITKVNLSTRLWNAPLEENFTVEWLPEPLKPGELPDEAPANVATNWTAKPE